MENPKRTVIVEMEDDRSITRACGVLTGIIGILGIVMPFTKQQVKESLQLSMMSIGISLSLLSIISITTNKSYTTSLKDQTNHGQKID